MQRIIIMLIPGFKGGSCVILSSDEMCTVWQQLTLSSVALLSVESFAREDLLLSGARSSSLDLLS